MLDRFETFATAIASINRCIQKIKDTEMRALGLRGIHVMCLYRLGKASEGLTASQLCALCAEDKAAVSRTIKDLTAQGYIRAEGQPGKRAYRARIFLTEKGQEAIAYILSRVEVILTAAGEGLGEEQRAAFYAALALIEENLRRQLAAKSPDNTPKGSDEEWQTKSGF